MPVYFTPDELEQLTRDRDLPGEVDTVLKPSSNVAKLDGNMEKLSVAEETRLNARIREIVPTHNIGEFTMKNNQPTDLEVCSCCFIEAECTIDCMICLQSYCVKCCTYFVDKKENRTVTRCLTCMHRESPDFVRTHGHFFKKCCKRNVKL